MSDVHPEAIAETATFNYFVPPAELLAIERQMYEYAKSVGRTGLVSLVMEASHPWSDFVRTHEEQAFPGASTAVPYAQEIKGHQMALVDARRQSPAQGRVIHCGSVSGLRDVKPDQPNTGILAVDELLETPGNDFTTADFIAYCQKLNIDPSRVLSMDTTIKLHPGLKRYRGMTTVGVGHLLLQGMIKLKRPGTIRNAAIIARANKKSAASMQRTGIRLHNLMDRTEWESPEETTGQDGDYRPVVILLRDNLPLIGLGKLMPKPIQVPLSVGGDRGAE